MTTRMSNGQPTLSELVLEIDWDRWFPRPLGSMGAVMRPAKEGEVEAFFGEHHAALLDGEQSRFAQLEASEAKARFTRVAMDPFAIEREGRIVGVFVGQLWDWSSYYLRYLAVLPEARGLGSVSGIIGVFAEILRSSGIERIEADVSIGHLTQLRRVLGCNFHVMGTLQSERWGSVVHLVHFLSPRHEGIFLDQFAAGPRTRIRLGPDQANPTDPRKGD